MPDLKDDMPRLLTSNFVDGFKTTVFCVSGRRNVPFGEHCVPVKPSSTLVFTPFSRVAVFNWSAFDRINFVIFSSIIFDTFVFDRVACTYINVCLANSCNSVRVLAKSKPTALSSSALRPRPSFKCNWLQASSIGEQSNFVTCALSRSAQIKILSPVSPKPARPARPIICKKRERLFVRLKMISTSDCESSVLLVCICWAK